MTANRRKNVRRAAFAALGLAVVAALALALRPVRVEVETAAAARGPLRVTVDATGKTRVRGLYVVASPVPGHLLRLAFREGDAVRAGEVVARIAPAAPPPLDARSRAEAAGRLEAARAAVAETRAGVERARVAAAQAERDLSRARDLASGGSVAAADVEAAELARSARREEARMAESAAARAAGEAESAWAAVAAHGIPASQGAGGGARALELRAPVAGRVLRVLRESEGPIAAGAPLLELGDPAALEAEVELLTAQAVRVRPGAAVEIVRWGGEAPLRGAVRAVDPAGFTKVSALGVEEQRVHAVVVPVGPGWERLGDGFSVEARIVVSERKDALKVPASALFRSGAAWSTFAVERGRARLRRVEVAESSGEELAISSGIAEGERVVLHPSDKLADGVRVAAR